MSVIRKVLRERRLDDRLQNYERLERLKQLEKLQQFQSNDALQRLQRLDKCKIEIFNSDYRAINIQPNSIIYCDIPYLNTAKYTNSIDHAKFSIWCRRQVVPVYVSSYEINVPGFEVVAEIEKRVLMNIRRSKNQFKMEKLYRYRRP